MATKETENAKLEIDIVGKSSQLDGLLASLTKQIRSLAKVSSDIKLGVKKGDLETVNNLKSQYLSLRNVLEDLSKVVGRKGAASIDNMADRFKYLSKVLVPLRNNLKAINQQLSAYKIAYSGIDSLFNKAAYAGQKDQINYGTSLGNQINDKKLQISLLKQQSELEKLNLEILKYKNPEQYKAVKQQEAYNKAIERSTTILPAYQLHIMANYTAINKLVSGFKYLINYTVQYDEELHQLQAISGMTNTSLKSVRDTIESVAMATEFSSLELAKASTVLAQAGLSATQIKRTLPSIAKLATATGTDLATSTDVITSTLNVYNMQVSEAEHVTNALTTAMNESKATIAQFQTALQYAGNITSQLGISFEETTAAISAMTQAGIRSKSTLGTGLRSILTELSKPTKNLITQLNKVGLSVEDVDVRTKGLSNVLKTLKEAGFGVTEALRGMQRRSASALVALTSQVEFMDELRLKMAGSTAATKANETQMEALAKQIKNFKNVLSNAATQGLEPFIRLLSDLLAMLNKMFNSPAGKAILSTLLTGAAAGGILKTVTLVGASIKSIAQTFGIFGSNNYISGISKTITLFQMVSARYGTLAAIGPAFRTFLGSFTGIATLATVIYQIADALGAFESAGEKARAKLDELKGEVEEEKTTFEIIKGFQERLLRDRERLNDSTEKNIFIREVLTRLPEANKLLKVTESSLEDVAEALQKLNEIKLDKTIQNLEKMAKAARDATLGGIEEDIKNAQGGQRWFDRFRVHTKDVKQRLAGFDQLRQIFPEIIKENILDYVPYNPIMVNKNNRKELVRYIKSASGTGIDVESRAIPSIISDLRKYYQGRTDLTDIQKASQLEALTADKDINSLIGSSLKSLAEEFRSMGDLLKAKLDKGILTEFADDTKKIIENTVNSIDSFDKTIKDTDFYLQRGVSLTDEQTQNLNDTVNNLAVQLDSLTNLDEAKTYEDLRKAFNYDQETLDKKISNVQKIVGKQLSEEDVVKAIVNSEDKGSRTQLIMDISEKFNKLIDLFIEKGFPIPEGMAKDVSIYDRAIKQAEKNMSKSKNKKDIEKYSSIVESNIRNKESLEIANINKDTKLTEIEKTNRLNTVRNMATRALDANTKAADKYIKKLTDTGPKFDTAAASLNKFFKDLEADINKVEIAYSEAEKALDSVLAKQQGRITATGLVFGKSSGIVQYEQNRLESMQDAQIADRLANLNESLYGVEVNSKKVKEGYVDILEKLRSNKDFQDVTSRYSAAESRYDTAIAKGNWNEAREANRIMKDLASANKKYTDEEKKLTTKITDLEKQIDELNTTIKDEEALSKMSATEQLGLGWRAATSNYVKENKDKGIMNLAGAMSELSTQGINTLDSAMTTMFQNIADGSKKAGDAFRDFGKSVIQTLRDVAIQMAVRQGLTALFSGFMGSSTPAIEQSGGTSATTVFYGPHAIGGLIKGPVKNRDSVPTMLMPGEYVMKKSAVDTLGRDYLDSLNSNASAALYNASESISDSKSTTTADESTGAGGIVNVYVVGQEQQQSMTPNDVLVTITQDMLKGGQTKKLVKSIAMGSL